MSTADLDVAGRTEREPEQPATMPAFLPTPLPVIGALPGSGTGTLGAPAGVALAFAAAETDACGEDRFDLLLVDAEGEVLARMASFHEDDIVALWRDLALKSGLPRMILREDGGLSVVSRQIGRVALGATRQRRRHGLLNGRRPRFLVRRKTARLPARPQVHRGESEIIARS